MSRSRFVAEEAKLLNCLERLQRLRFFDGEPTRFWSVYLDLLIAISSAESGLIAVKDQERGSTWRVVSLAPQSLKSGPEADNLLVSLQSAENEILKDGQTKWEQDGKTHLAIRLAIGSGRESCLAAVTLDRPNRSQVDENLMRLRLVSDLAAEYQSQRIARESITRVEHFASVLDLMVLINEKKRFLAAGMTFCNELASRHKCERVSMGWLDRGYIRIQAVSHTDHFDRKMEAVQKLEATMEEALDQNTEIVLPVLPGRHPVSRDHEQFIRNSEVPNICSLPLRVDDEPVAVCTCERSTEPFSEVELRLLRLSCDQAARRLSDLKRTDRWFGARFATFLREKLEGLLGYKHTWAKVIGILLAGLLGFLIFGQIPYRLSAPTILRTDDVAYLTAPFDGHIDTVSVRVGDSVSEGDTLLTLDQSDLLLRKADLVAETNRYAREFEKARASNAPADMRISQALYSQASARLDLIQYFLDKSVIFASFDGVVVEGDLTERIGSPVKQGDVLFKLARIDRLYAELEVSESDVHELQNNMQGEVALASRPQERYGIQVFRMEPAAVAKEEGNVFIVHCNFPDGSLDWWRPGMTGIAKLDVGKRSPLWIVTHRTIDFLRLRFW
jgi:hypothetical protein